MIDKEQDPPGSLRAYTAAVEMAQQRFSGRREADGGLVHEVAEQVFLTNYTAFELFMSECHTIRRESGVFEPRGLLESPQSRPQRHLSPGDSARGTDHESSEEEGEIISLPLSLYLSLPLSLSLSISLSISLYYNIMILSGYESQRFHNL